MTNFLETSTVKPTLQIEITHYKHKNKTTSIYTHFLLLPPDQRREADHKGQHPQPGDERLGPPGGHDARVGDGTRDGDVAIERDRAQVQDGRGAHPDVDGEPHAAPHVTEDPYLSEGEKKREINLG